MKNQRNRIALVALTFLFGSIIAVAQTAQPNISGTYEGMATRPGATAEEKISLELKSDAGKITGRATHGNGSADVTEGKLENGVLTLTFCNDAKFVARFDGDKLVGEVVHGHEKMRLELKRVTLEAAHAVAPGPGAAAAVFNLNGQWEAMADANGQPFPFLLTLKLDGESVSGNSSSQLGEAVVKNGVWKDGRLVFELEGSNGTIVMSATVIEGKLAGEFDYSGQLQGKWVAVKKN